MNDHIRALLEKSTTHDAGSPDFKAWTHGVLADFPIKAYAVLRSFKIKRFDYASGKHDFWLQPHEPLVEEAESLARHAWRAIGGDQEPMRGCACGLASIENVRAQLHSVFWIGSWLNSYRTHRPEAAHRFVDSVLTIDWHDAEAVLKANFQAHAAFGIQESAADNLQNWIMTTDRPRQAPELASQFPDALFQATKPYEVMPGAALLALDAALASGESRQSIGLMSRSQCHVASRMAFGMGEPEELWREEARHAGKKGGTQRHQASRELKLWALAKAVSLRGSDVDVARQLALQVPAQLRDASADPERLIYDALRSARKSERQGG